MVHGWFGTDDWREKMAEAVAAGKPMNDDDAYTNLPDGAII